MKKFLLIILSICSLAFASNVFIDEVYAPFSKHTFKCEGIVLDTTSNYHITEKSSIADLRKIRGNDIDIKSDDVLLHYRDQDMDKVTPSYWGTLFYSENGWNFLLDKSFSSENKVQSPLPFMRYIEQVNNTSEFVEPNSILNQKDLHKGLLVNISGGKKASRFYLQLKDTLFPWYDEGIKREVNLRDNDTIGIAFNKSFKTQLSKNFSFTNTTHHSGLYNLIYDNKADHVVKIINEETGDVVIPQNMNTLQLGDLVFSVKRNLSFGDQILLACYLLISFFSVLYFLNKKQLTVFESWVNAYSVILCCFLLLGSATMVDTFIYQNYGIVRKFCLAIVIPLLPLLAAKYNKILIWFLNKNLILDIIKFIHNSKFFNLLQRIYSRAESLLHNELKESKQEAYKFIENKTSEPNQNSLRLWSRRMVFQLLILVAFFAVVLIPLLFTYQERVLGRIPVMHYSLLVIYVLFLTIYTEYFTLFFVKIISSSKHLIKNRKLIQPFLLLLFSIIISVISKDVGTSMIIAVSLLLYEGLKGKQIHIHHLKLNITWLLFILPILSVVLFFLDLNNYELFRKFYRVTYSFANPANELYSNVNNSDRESFAFIYQGLLSLVDHPFGIDNIYVPNYKRSICHTDFSMFWTSVKYGVFFIGTLLFGIALLIFNLLSISRTLLVKEISCNKSTYVRSFLAFLVVIFLMNCLVPLCSNLFLPGAFLTGIPLPFISISIGTGIVVFAILALLHSIVPKGEKELLVENENKAMSYSSFSLGFLIVWIGIKIFFFSNNEDSYWKLDTSNEYVEAFLIEEPKNNQQILEAKAKVFKDVDSDQLTYKQKEASKFINTYYYNKNNVNNLSKNKGFFYLSKHNFLNEVSLDSLHDFSPKRISGEEWKGSPVFSKPYLVNGKAKTKITSPYWENIYLDLNDLDKDASANINVKLENHLKQNLKAYKNLKAAVVVINNDNGKLLVNSAYPFGEEEPEARLNFFPASVKKTLLASYVIEEDLYDDKAEVEKWIKKSSNPLTKRYMQKVLTDTLAFDKYLKEEFELPFYGGFTEVGWDANEKTASNTFIGGYKPYTPMEIAGWTKIISNKAFKDKGWYFEVFNQPLQKGGTAIDVANALRKNGYDVSNYIAKTGTLEINTKGINLSSSFVIANEQYSIVVLIGGKQPENDKKLTAKYLYIDLIDELKKYM